MIFNQISKELTNSRLKRGQYDPHNYQPSTYNSRINNSNYLAGSRASQSSAISQMNQRIIDNMEHLKYKDYVRESLRNSRHSSRSNKSLKSHHSVFSQHSHSIRKPIVEVASKFRFNDVRTSKDQHYFPVRPAIKPEFATWEKPTLQRPRQQHAYTQPTPDTQYRQVLRKPITIEQYNKKYDIHQMERTRQPQRDMYEKNDFASPVVNRRNSKELPFQMFRTSSNERLENGSKDEYMSSSLPQKKDWAHSFGHSFGKQVPKNYEPVEVYQPAIQSNNSSKVIEPPPPAKVNSPLDLASPSKPKIKPSLIVVVVLAILGLSLLTLQIIK